MGYEDFRNKVCTYCDSMEDTQGKIPKLKTALDLVAYKELPERDGQYVLKFRDFTNSGGLDFSLSLGNVLCYYDTNDRQLIGGARGPAWRTG